MIFHSKIPKVSMMDTNNESIAAKIKVDKTRIRDADGFVATIRYVGTVASAKNTNEVYAGVEWDDYTRGKHDGSVICRKTNKLVRHFTLKYPSSQGGSFLRINKIDTGVDLDLKLLKSRYVEPDAPLVAPNNLLPYSARTSSGRAKPIEFLGEMNVRKRQQLEDLEEISLRGMGITRISDQSRDEMMKMFGHVTEIDLSGNLISDWDVLCDVMSVFPAVKWISFASNKMYDMPSTSVFKEGEWSQLKVLNVNSVGIASFQTIKVLEKLCPNLEELCVAYSDLSDNNNLGKQSDAEEGTPAAAATASAVEGFQHLKILDCSSCNFSDWNTQVRAFRKLPKLETLIIDNNPIPFVELTKEATETEFANLSNLQIAGSAIHEWAGIECIGNFRNLKSLRFRQSPLTDTIGTGEARAGTIARVPQISQLNMSRITEKERIEAERRYVSVVSREILKLIPNNVASGDDLSEVQKKLYRKYPQFEELMVKHKETMIAAQSSASNIDGMISNSVVNVTIKSMAAESCTCEQMQKKLPSSMKVQRLKVMCARMFRLDIELQKLHFRSEGDAFPTELDDDENTIGYYGVSDGSEILMNEIDLEAMKREDKHKTDMLLKRIEEQEEASNTLQTIQKNDMRAHLNAAERASNQLSK
jgi:hypothetical protein